MRVSARALSVTVGARTLFKDLEFSWAGPALVAVIGPSGAGKSTLLSILMGWTRPASGSVEFAPSNPSVWLVPQNAPLLDSRTVVENLKVALLAERADCFGESDVAAALRTYGLNGLEGTLGKHLSGGERQRVALARAALRGPKVLLADEVTAGLDPASVDRVTDALRSLAAGGTLVVVATHDSRVWSVADHVLDLATVAQ